MSADEVTEDLDTFMFGVLIRQACEERTKNRVDYHAALDWVLDLWRLEDEPQRKRLTVMARALAVAMESPEWRGTA